MSAQPINLPSLDITAVLPTSPMPNEKGEFNTPAEGAKFMAALGIPQIPLRGKAPWFPAWQGKGSTNFAQIDRWYAEFKCNFGSIAKAEIGGIFILEFDSADVSARYAKATGKEFASKFKVRSSSDDRGHRYYLQSAESISFGNCSQEIVTGNDFSVRASDEQCVSPGSISPKNGRQYACLEVGPLEVMPADELAWLRSQKKAQRVPATVAGDKIPYGSHDNELTRIGGALRHSGLERNAIVEALIEVCEKRCENYGSDYHEMCEKIADSVCRYPVGKDERILFGGVPGGTVPAVNPSLLQVAPVTAQERPDIDTSGVDKPDFPFWVFTGTSLYENLVKPAIEGSARHPELVFMPAAIVVMNYLAGRVYLENEEVNLVQFLGLISPPGDYVKSGSCKIAFNYCEAAGVLSNNAVTNPDGKVVISTASSSEGFGKAMFRLNATHGILFFDELGNFVSKAGIENSSFSSQLLSMAERGLFQSQVKSAKDCFVFPADSYAFSWIWCTTTIGFPRHWAKIAGLSSGMDDRMVFVLHDEKQKTGKNTKIDLTRSTETRKRIDYALEHPIFKFEDPEEADRLFAGLNNNLRSENRAKAFALFFAVELGLQEINGECVDRGIAIANYVYQINKYLEPIEADNPEARLECAMVRVLRKHRGMMRRREFQDEMHKERYGDRLWEGCYGRLLRNKTLVEWRETVNSPQSVMMVGIRKRTDDE